MANGGNIPVTVIGSLGSPETAMAIGSAQYNPPSSPGESYWLVVVDLTDLQVVANVVSQSNSEVPSEVQQYAGNPQYMLVVATQAVTVDQVAQGDLYQLMVSAGAGTELARAEQLNYQFSSAWISAMSYILVGTMDTGRGYEELSFNYSTLLTCQLIPVTVDGKTIYSLVELGAE